MSKKDRLFMKDENPQGLHMKYVVQKIEGWIRSRDFFDNLCLHPKLKPVDKNAEYFILRLDEHGDDPIHIEACRKAVLTYAREIKGHIPQLAKDLIERYGERPDERSQV